MGSGPSKENGNTRSSRSKPVTVANVNNNTTEPVRTVESKSVTRNEPESPPAKYPLKESNLGSSKPEQALSVSVKNVEGKSTEKMEWNDSDIEGDDWDDFLGKSSKNTVSKTDTKIVTHDKQEMDLNSHYNGQSEEHYPETYAQRHTRQQYTFGQDRLLREKTIYRNPDEWQIEDDEEENKMSYQTSFNASKFRAANQGQMSARDKEIFTTQEDDFETPKYTHTDEPKDTLQHNTNQRKISRRLPSYTKEEEDLMQELMGGMDTQDFFFAHQAVNPANVRTF